MTESLNHSLPEQQDKAAALNAVPPPVPSADGKHFKTKGEHKFDRLTYSHIGYLANVAVSIAAVYWVERTHSGQKTMRTFMDWTKKKLPKVNPKTAEWLAARSFYLTGGFAVIPPMKILEDHKVEMVKKYDREIYGDAVDTDPTLIKSHQELEAAPRQNWPSIISSRLLALVPFYATVGLIWGNRSVLARVTNKEFRGMSKQALDALAESNPAQFADKARHGLFFDRPIATVSRAVGGIFSKLTGSAKATEQIAEMSRQYPAMLKEAPIELAAKTGSAAGLQRDPNHAALPYYFISEMITSAMVAWGVFVLTRVLAPIIGKKVEKPQPPTPKPHTEATPEVLAKVKEDVANENDKEKPRAHVLTDSIEHNRATPALEAVAR